MKSFIHDPERSSLYHEEFLDLINYYKNFAKGNFYIRYYKLNRSLSPHQLETDASYSRILQNNIYDIYEYTPTLEISPISDRSENSANTVGGRFNSETRLTTFTIEKCNIFDLISFPYKPNNHKEVFRVKEIETTINANKSRGINIYNLTLEPANLRLEQMNDIKINDHYVFLLPEKKYILYREFEELMTEIETIKTRLSEMYYDENREFYSHLSYSENKRLYDFLNRNRNLFTDYKIPFGYYKLEFIEKKDSDHPIFESIQRISQIAN